MTTDTKPSTFQLSNNWYVERNSNRLRLLDEEGDEVMQLPGDLTVQQADDIAVKLEMLLRRTEKMSRELGADEMRTTLARVLGFVQAEDHAKLVDEVHEQGSRLANVQGKMRMM